MVRIHLQKPSHLASWLHHPRSQGPSREAGTTCRTFHPEHFTSSRLLLLLLLPLLLSRFSLSDSVRPHRRQSTRLPHPWGSPGKNTGVGCHFLLRCMKVKSESKVAQSCPTLSNPMDCSLPGSSIHGIFQARVLEWGAIAFSVLTFWQLVNQDAFCNGWQLGIVL